MAQDLSSDQYDALIKERPSGMSPEDATRKMVAKGYTFGGKKLDPQTLKPANYTPQEKGLEETVPGLDVAADVLDISSNALQSGLTKIGVPPSVAGIPSAALATAGKLIPTTPKDAATQFLSGPLINEGGAAIKEGLIKLFPGLEAKVPNIITAVKAAMAHNVPLTPGQITETGIQKGTNILGDFERGIGNIAFTGTPIQKAKIIQEKAYNDARMRVLDKIGPSSDISLLGEKVGTGMQQIVDSKLAEREAALENAVKNQRAVTDSAIAKQKAIAEKGYKSLEHAKEGMLNITGPDSKLFQMGEMLKETVAAQSKIASEQQSRLFNPLFKMIPPEADKAATENLDAMVKSIASENSNSVKGLPPSKAQPLIERLIAGPSNNVIEDTPQIAHELPPEFNEAIKRMSPDVLKKNPQLMAAKKAMDAMSERKSYTFKELQTMRSGIGKRIAAEDSFARNALGMKGGTTPEGAVYKRLYGSLSKDMDAFAQKMGPGFRNKYYVANAFSKDFHNKFNNSTIQGIVSSHPEDVYQFLLGTDDRHISELKQLKSVIGTQSQAFQALQRRYTSGLVQDSTGKILPSAKIAQNLADTAEQAREVLPQYKVNQLKDFAKKVSEHEESVKSGELATQDFVKSQKLPEFVESELEKKIRSTIHQVGGFKSPGKEIIDHITLGGDPVIARLTKNILGEKDFAPIRRNFFERIIGTPHTPEMTAAEIPKNKDAIQIREQLERYGSKELRDVMGSSDDWKQINELEKIRAAIDRTKGQNESIPRGLLYAAAGGGAGTMYMLARSPGPTAAAIGAFTIGARELAELYTSKLSRDLLIKGFEPVYASGSGWSKTGVSLLPRLQLAVMQAKRKLANEDMIKQGKEPVFQ